LNNRIKVLIFFVVWWTLVYQLWMKPDAEKKEAQTSKEQLKKEEEKKWHTPQ
jgi:preprotein translocase subunit YajC